MNTSSLPRGWPTDHASVCTSLLRRIFYSGGGILGEYLLLASGVTKQSVEHIVRPGSWDDVVMSIRSCKTLELDPGVSDNRANQGLLPWPFHVASSGFVRKLGPVSCWDLVVTSSTRKQPTIRLLVHQRHVTHRERRIANEECDVVRHFCYNYFSCVAAARPEHMAHTNYVSSGNARGPDSKLREARTFV